MRKLALVVGIATMSFVALLSAAAAAPQTSTLHYFGDPDQTPGTEVAGSSGQLVRTPTSIQAQLNTNDLDPGAYTVWWVIWNDPAVCAGECGADDLGAAGNSVARATGAVVGDSGLGNFGASLSVGDTSEALFGPGITDPDNAEVHMIVRYHGPVVAEFMPAQINSVGGGCGSFDCFDPQAIAFLP